MTYRILALGTYLGPHTARRCALRYPWPVLLTFGASVIVRNVDGGDVGDGLQCVLFRPGCGSNVRVHFGRGVSDGPVRLQYGEIGDAL